MQIEKSDNQSLKVKDPRGCAYAFPVVQLVIDAQRASLEDSLYKSCYSSDHCSQCPFGTVSGLTLVGEGLRFARARDSKGLVDE